MSNNSILFWDVDTQVDFMQPGGRLYVPGAEELTDNLERLTEAADRYDIPVIASADDHTAGDAEISDEPDFDRTYPPHCMRGTPGWEKIPETRLHGTVTLGHEPLSESRLHHLALTADRFLILKKQFDVFSNPNTERLLRKIDPRQIVLYGVALDVCNLYAVEGLWRRGYRNLAVITDAVRPIRPERGAELLAEWRRRGIELTTTDELLARLERRVPAAAVA